MTVNLFALQDNTIKNNISGHIICDTHITVNPLGGMDYDEYRSLVQMFIGTCEIGQILRKMF